MGANQSSVDDQFAGVVPTGGGLKQVREQLFKCAAWISAVGDEPCAFIGISVGKDPNEEEGRAVAGRWCRSSRIYGGTAKLEKRIPPTLIEKEGNARRAPSFYSQLRRAP
jgi:hypothetical protein